MERRFLAAQAPSAESPQRFETRCVLASRPLAARFDRAGNRATVRDTTGRQPGSSNVPSLDCRPLPALAGCEASLRFAAVVLLDDAMLHAIAWPSPAGAPPLGAAKGRHEPQRAPLTAIFREAPFAGQQTGRPASGA